VSVSAVSVSAYKCQSLQVSVSTSVKCQQSLDKQVYKRQVNCDRFGCQGVSQEKGVRASGVSEFSGKLFTDHGLALAARLRAILSTPLSIKPDSGSLRKVPSDHES